MSIETIVVLGLVGALFVWFFKNEKKVEEPSTPEVVEEEKDLASMTKAELIEFAESVNIDVKVSWTKSKIITTIEAALTATQGRLYER